MCEVSSEGEALSAREAVGEGVAASCWSGLEGAESDEMDEEADDEVAVVTDCDCWRIVAGVSKSIRTGSLESWSGSKLTATPTATTVVVVVEVRLVEEGGELL